VTEGEFLGPIGNATAKYQASNPVVRHLLNRFLLRVDEAAASLEPTSVLDVGCGEGVVTERLAHRLAPAKVLGVDADVAHLKAQWDSRRATNISFAAGSAYNLPFADRSFDLVCCIEVLEHLERPRDALAEMSRVAERALLLSVPNEPGWRISHLLAGRDVRKLGDTPGHINHWSKRTFAELVSDYGRLEKVESVFPWTLAVTGAQAAQLPSPPSPGGS
jgi:2-polyprenyl-3-methyl-5-hydroxy-6-metoxy-1,4-benzoquinol methylase